MHWHNTLIPDKEMHL